MLCPIGQSNEKPPLQVLAKWREYVTRSICYDSFTNWDEKIKGEDTLTKEDMKQISDLMDEKFIASEGRMRAEIVASEARTGEKIDRVENNLSAEIKKNRISMTRHMQELNAKWVETNEKLDRMLARMDGMDKNMSAMRAEMDAVPKRFDAVETNLGRKISESEAATRRYTEKLFFQVAEGKKKRSVRSSGLEG